MSDFAGLADQLQSMQSAPASPTFADQADNLQALKNSPAPVPTTASTQPDLPWYERLIQGVKDPFNATANLLMHSPLGKASMAVNQAITSGGGLFPNAVSETMGGLGQSVSDATRQGEKAYQAARGPNAGIDLARGVGNVLNPINWVAPEMGSTGLAANMARGAAGAVLSSPVTDPNYASGLAKIAGAGAIGGAILTPIAGAL